MTSDIYYFDVIITRLEANQEFIEPKCLTVDVMFHKLSFRLTSSHINVERFGNEPMCVFKIPLDELRYMVGQLPVMFMVNYKTENIGLCETLWPCEKVENVHSCMEEIFHIGKCDIKSDGKIVGVLEYVMRIKKQPERPEKKLSALQLHSNLQNLLNPCDSCFIAPAKVPQAAEKNSADDSTDYRESSSGKTFNILPSSGSTPLNKESTEAEHTGATFVVDEQACWKQCWWCEPNNSIMEKINETRFTQPKQCPICHHNLKWLPNFSPCPNCGFKQGPIVVPPEKRMSTEQIIEKYADFSTDSETDPLRICSLKDKTPRAKDRCSCGGKGTCAFCRVHKLVEHLIAETKDKKSSDHSIEKCDKDATKLFSTCRTKTHPSFLAKVLSEMTMLLDVKFPPKPKEVGVNKKCDEMINAVILKNETAKKIAQKHRILKCKKDKAQSSANAQTVKNKLQKSNIKEKRKQIVQPEVVVKKSVPAHMGYLWTKSEFGRRKPGYIDKDVKRIMHYFLNVHPTLSEEAKRLTMENIEKICKENEVIQPTLKVTKKDDAYYICLKSDTNDPTKRVIYKIVKYPYLKEYSKLKRMLKAQGFLKCVCHKPVAECICRDRHERKALEKEIIKYCCQRNMPACHEDLVLSDTSMSEADLEFDVTAPGACARSAPNSKPLYVNQGSQYNKQDLERPSAQKNANIAYKFVASYDCAVGRKYGEQVYIPQPGEVLPATEWVEYVKEQKKAARAARKKKQLKPGKIERLKPKPVHESGPPFGAEGPPKVARDGTALDVQGKTLLDNDGNAYDVQKTMDGRLKVKPKKKGLNMIKYLIKKGLIVKKKTGRNPPKLPPGGISPQYLAMERALKCKRYRELFQHPPGILCKIDRLGRSYPCCGGRDYIC